MYKTFESAEVHRTDEVIVITRRRMPAGILISHKDYKYTPARELKLSKLCNRKYILIGGMLYCK